jgi:hypothetical protein
MAKDNKRPLAILGKVRFDSGRFDNAVIHFVCVFIEACSFRPVG